LLFRETNHINTFDDDRGVWFKNGVYNWSPSAESISSYTTGVIIGDRMETIQSMSVVPEPSGYLMMLAGLASLSFFSCKRSGLDCSDSDLSFLSGT
ncbi:MAG: PEP-CTERM sorting domain-containing protein, partial [Nitrosospira sp.]